MLTEFFAAHSARTMFGEPGNPASARERAAFALALGDLVLVAVAEDLLDDESARALSEDGEAILSPVPSSALYEEAGIEVGGPVSRPGSGMPTRLTLALLAAVIASPLGYAFASAAFGTMIGLVIGAVVATVCVALAFLPRRRRTPSM
jgi:hypothetical protein